MTEVAQSILHMGSGLPAAGVRRSGRVSKEIPIILSGDDTEGRQFSETTKTLVLSRHGASVLSQRKLIPEQEVFLRPVAAGQEIEVRICGEIGKREDGYIYGVAFVDPSVDFWGIEFPPGERLANDLARVTLECTGCRQSVVVQLDAMEMDVYVVNEGVWRFCKRCVTSTLWKLTGEKAAPDTPAAIAHKAEADTDAQEEPKSKTPSATEVPTTPATNRRKDRRTKVNLTACIRTLGRADEIVTCKDMSRGGFCFHSTRQYSDKAIIEVAVPYTAGDTAIFVPAQIANVRKLPSGNLYRYGAAYVRSRKN